MSIKFANEIIKEIEKRGTINLPKERVCGEEFESWLYDNDEESEEIENERENC